MHFRCQPALILTTGKLNPVTDNATNPLDVVLTDSLDLLPSTAEIRIVPQLKIWSKYADQLGEIEIAPGDPILRSQFKKTAPQFGPLFHFPAAYDVPTKIDVIALLSLARSGVVLVAWLTSSCHS